MAVGQSKNDTNLQAISGLHDGDAPPVRLGPFSYSPAGQIHDSTNRAVDRRLPRNITTCFMPHVAPCVVLAA